MDNRIERFLTNKMSDEERTQFLQEMKGDKALEQTVVLYQEMEVMYNDEDWSITHKNTQHPKVVQYHNFLTSEKGKQLKQHIAEAGAAYFAEEAKPQKRGIRRILWATSSIAAVFIVGFFLLKDTGNHTSLTLYNEFYNQWSELPSLTQRGNDTTLATVETLYTQQRYAEALTLLNQLQQQNSKLMDAQLFLYIGVLNLELGKHDAAIQAFKKVLASNSLDAFKAHWYLALAYLKIDEVVLAKKELNILLADESMFKDVAAKKILKKLSKQ